MKTEVEDLGGSQRKLKFDITPEEVDKKIDKYCKKVAKEVDVHGFRKGKAPASVIKRYFRHQIFGEIASELVSSSLEEALKEHSLTPMGEPDVDMPTLEEGKSFPFSVTLDIRPEIDVKDYQGIELEEEPVEVEDEEVQKALEELQKAHSKLKGVEEEREVVTGDVVLVDYLGSLDGETLPDTEKKDAYIEIGSGSFSKDVEEALLGARVGDARESDVEYPANFAHEQLAGKKIQYRFQIKQIMVKELPPLDDEFAKDVGAFEDLKTLETRIREQITNEKKLRSRQQLEEKLLDEIVERNPFEAPRSLVNARKGQMLIEARSHFMSRGLNLEESPEDSQRLETEFEALAEKEIKKHLLMEAIAQKESLAVSDEELDTQIQDIAEKHSQSVEKLRADIQKREDGLDEFRQSLLRQKTLDFLLPGKLE